MSRLHITSATELTIDFGDGRRFAVHPLWLRERCPDAQTFDLRTGQRLSDPSDLDLNLALAAISRIAPATVHRGSPMTRSVSFRRMEDGTREDYLPLDESERKYAAGLADRVLVSREAHDPRYESPVAAPPGA